MAPVAERLQLRLYERGFAGILMNKQSKNAALAKDFGFFQMEISAEIQRIFTIKRRHSTTDRSRGRQRASIDIAKDLNEIVMNLFR